jgi:hypothetical protein
MPRNHSDPTMMDSSETIRPKESHPVLLLIGIPLIFFAALLAWRTIWEETSLSLEQGPQMIGFSMAHGPFAIFLFVPIILMFWLVVALIVMGVSLWRRQSLSKLFWASISAGSLAIATLSLPQAFWQYILIQSFAKSPHAVDFMAEDAAEGYPRTVAAYLAHGVPINARDSDGATAAHAAAVGGSVAVLELLRSKGADLNAINSRGNSPLTDAIEMKRDSAIAYLRAHGALEIKPVPPPPGRADVTVRR